MLILRAKISLRDAFTYKYFSSSNFAIQKKNSLEVARLQIQGEKQSDSLVQVSSSFSKFTLSYFAFIKDLH